MDSTVEGEHDARAFLSHGGTPIPRWFFREREYPKQTWMRTGGTPMTQEIPEMGIEMGKTLELTVKLTDVPAIFDDQRVRII